MLFTLIHPNQPSPMPSITIVSSPNPRTNTFTKIPLLIVAGTAIATTTAILAWMYKRIKNNHSLWQSFCTWYQRRSRQKTKQWLSALMNRFGCTGLLFAVMQSDSIRSTGHLARGILNFANTCYLNSLLQALAASVGSSHEYLDSCQSLSCNDHTTVSYQLTSTSVSSKNTNQLQHVSSQSLHSNHNKSSQNNPFLIPLGDSKFAERLMNILGLLQPMIPHNHLSMMAQYLLALDSEITDEECLLSACLRKSQCKSCNSILEFMMKQFNRQSCCSNQQELKQNQRNPYSSSRTASSIHQILRNSTEKSKAIDPRNSIFPWLFGTGLE